MATAPNALTQLTAPRLPPGRRFLWAGLALAILGPAAFAFQLWFLRRLFTPWYAPVAATLGVALVVVALLSARSVGRVLALTIAGVLAVGQWYLLLELARLPAYAGPVAVGKALPSFETLLADGSPFGPANLAGKQNTVLVFFRGRL